jgi:WD40 repeat protein
LTTVPGVNLAATVSASPQTRVLVSSPEGATVYDLPNAAPRQVRIDSRGTIHGVAASGDGKRFVVVYRFGSLELRDTASGALVTPFDQQVDVFSIGHGLPERREVMVALDRGGTRVAFQAYDDRIYVVDDEGTTVKTINLSSRGVDLEALDLSDDGSELIISTSAGEAIWYDVDGSDSKTIAPLGSGFEAQFVPGDRVAVVGKSGAQIIDLRSSPTTKSLALGIDATRLAVDSTGRLLATADAMGSIQLWDANLVVRIGEPLHIRNVSSPVPIRFSVDGHYLVVSGLESTTWVDVSVADWPHLACSLVTEKLSPDERARYLGSVATSATCP